MVTTYVAKMYNSYYWVDPPSGCTYEQAHKQGWSVRFIQITPEQYYSFLDNGAVDIYKQVEDSINE